MSVKKVYLYPPPVRDSTLSKSEQRYLFSLQQLLPILVGDTSAAPEVFALPNAGLDNSATGQSNQDAEWIFVKGTADANSFSITGAVAGTIVLSSQYDFARFKSDGINWYLVGTGAAAFPVAPHSFPAVSHEWRNSYDSGTGLFTATEPAAADLSNGTVGTGAVVLASALPATINFVDNETPGGTINSSNTAFTLAFAPSPAGSLELFYNGLVQKSGGVDFTLSGLNITFASAPVTGSTLLAWYRK